MKLDTRITGMLLLLLCFVLTVGKPTQDVVEDEKAGPALGKQSEAQNQLDESGISKPPEKGGDNSDKPPSDAEPSAKSTVIPSSTALPKVEGGKDGNCSSSENGTCNTGVAARIMDIWNTNRGMMTRTFYVLIGVTGIVILYFVVKTVRLRRRRSKSRKYGVISTRGDDSLEMTPLDQDDDDEDMTVFEINGHPK